MQSQPDSQATGAGTYQMMEPVVRVTKLLGSLIFYFVSESWRFVCRLAGRNPPAIVTCIYYHHVPNDERQRFAAQMDHLLRWTAPLSSADQAPSAGGHYTVVTADDGWKSFAENAVPELVKRKIPATIFVISDRLGQTVDDIATDRIVSETELREIARVIRIGSHTATHPRMTELSEADARRELSESRTRLAAYSGGLISAFCFPYGAHNQELTLLARECGYQQVYVGVPAEGSITDAPIGRFAIDPPDSMLEFHLKIMGAYRWVHLLVRLKQKMLPSRRDKRALRLGGITDV
ncbi:MAG TPA: polysaccharide deacetylase family protein [Candidatus Binataceae bacterium]|nr:polysaccharide deacetylase family protein [Candidatus Binataceae bacterium]